MKEGYANGTERVMWAFMQSTQDMWGKIEKVPILTARSARGKQKGRKSYTKIPLATTGSRKGVIIVAFCSTASCVPLQGETERE